MKCHKNPLLSILYLSQAAVAQYIPQKSASGYLAGSSFGIAAHNATFDYVIIGGGLAGLVVAARLAEDPEISVAVIEPGTFSEVANGNNSQVPYYSTKWIASGAADYQPLIDWSLVTEPQSAANNARIHYAQGKGLGGSSIRNQMIYHRGTIGAYKRWASQVGDDDYLWKNYLQWFKKSVSFAPPTNQSLRAANATPQYQLSAYSDTGGPLHVSFPNFALSLSSYAAAAFNSIGFKEAKDFSSGKLSGYQYNPFSIDPSTGLRSSSESSFLSGALSSETQRLNSNLQVYNLAQATKILFNSSKAAIGVAVRSMGYDYVLTARKEVILSAGAWHSPQLLMLSGIGPRATLKKYDIPVIADRPGVGQNMWDTTNVGGVTHAVNVPTTGILSTQEGMESNVKAFLANRTGFLTTPGEDLLAWGNLASDLRANLSAAARAHLDSFPSDWPEIEHSMSSTGGSISGTQATSNLGTIGVLMIATASRGNMTISSASIDDPPVINPNWLLDPIDQEIAVAAVRQGRRAWSGIPNSIKGEELHPGSNVQTDSEILRSIQSSLTPIHHASASCAMGRANDSMAVVDSKGRVFGVSRLRVIDSSSLPFTPPGHTQGYTYAHAEKLVNDVKVGL